MPSEVLTDNGKQFTGRFTKPRPAEVLFGRVCREHGITAKLAGPYSPATTGKVERWHRTLRRELRTQPPCGHDRSRCRHPVIPGHPARLWQPSPRLAGPGT